MPSHPVVNRRNVGSPFVRRTMQASTEALELLAHVAAALSVSKASIVDTALHHLTCMEPAAIVELLRQNGHLTDEEYAFVTRLVGEG